jgi:hypothetical protein
MDARLLAHFSETTTRHILLIIRIIYFGNLSGNTWDAILSRLRGNPAPHSSILFEGFFFLLTGIAMLPAVLLSKNYRTAHP